MCFSTTLAWWFSHIYWLSLISQCLHFSPISLIQTYPHSITAYITALCYFPIKKVEIVNFHGQISETAELNLMLMGRDKILITRYVKRTTWTITNLTGYFVTCHWKKIHGFCITAIFKCTSKTLLLKRVLLIDGGNLKDTDTIGKNGLILWILR